MTSDQPRIWIIELGEGWLQVRLPEAPSTSIVPVTEIGPGDAHEDVAYETWLAHLGDVIHLEALRWETEAGEGGGGSV